MIVPIIATILQKRFRNVLIRLVIVPAWITEVFMLKGNE